MATIVSWNEPRPDKKLLVLDIDCTIAEFDYPITAKIRNARSHLITFLSLVYKRFDIAIWSSTEMEYILEKLTVLNMLNHNEFKILFALDSNYMVPINSLLHGKNTVKPLSVIWEMFEQYSDKNTIIIDDQQKNFYFNQRNGLLITPYHRCNYRTDEELLLLARYLKKLARSSTNISEEDLINWKLYI